jgi:hypothetical protein
MEEIKLAFISGLMLTHRWIARLVIGQTGHARFGDEFGLSIWTKQFPHTV